jgi:outer membrane protein TolC
MNSHAPTRHPISDLTWIGVCLSAMTLSLPPAGAAAEAANEPPANSDPALSLDRVLTEVVSSNPALKAAHAHWEAMGARVPQARAWEDLRVGVDVERAGTTRFDTFTDNEWMLAQTIPLSGKNRQRARAASAETEAARADLRRRELDLTARARAAYYHYANAYAQLELNRTNETLLNRIADLCRDKQRAGKRTEADALAVDSEGARLLEARLDLERQLSDERSQLNVLMNRPAHAELGFPVHLVFKPLVVPRFVPPPSPHGPGEDRFNFDWPLFQQQMQSLALTQRPDLLSAQKRIQAAQAHHRLAKREWIPDPELRVEARQFHGAARDLSEYDTGIFFNLPWLNRGKYKAAILEAQKNLESVQHELAALQTEALGMVRDQTKKIETLQNHYQFLRDRLVPLSRQTLQAAQAASIADQITILELLAAQRGLLNAESMLEQHLADYLSAIAELEAMVDVRLEFPPADEPRP